jgi:hypothetical protein
MLEFTGLIEQLSQRFGIIEGPHTLGFHRILCKHAIFAESYKK